jgi:hypothetical protein
MQNFLNFQEKKAGPLSTLGARAVGLGDFSGALSGQFAGCFQPYLDSA